MQPQGEAAGPEVEETIELPEEKEVGSLTNLTYEYFFWTPLETVWKQDIRLLTIEPVQLAYIMHCCTGILCAHIISLHMLSYSFN